MAVRHIDVLESYCEIAFYIVLLTFGIVSDTGL